jgi:MazG family protein
VLWKLGNDVLGDGKVGSEAGQVAVVNADDARTDIEGTEDLGFLVHLKDAVEAGKIGCPEKIVHFGIGKGTDNDEDTGGTGLSRFQYLEGMDKEVLAERGRGVIAVAEEVIDIPEILDSAVEIGLIGENGERVSPGIVVNARLFSGIATGSNFTGRRRAALHFGNYGKAFFAAECLFKGVRVGAFSKPGQFLVADRADASSEILAGALHDFRELIHSDRQMAVMDEGTPKLWEGTRFSVGRDGGDGYPEGGSLMGSCRLEMNEKKGSMSAIEDLLETMARLRGPGGCPWDHEQTHQTLTEPLIDEVSELLETIDREDMEHMEEELGDVLLQVVFHSQIAKEGGHFDFEAVARGINDKLVRRHPHVFGEVDLQDSEAVLKQWDAIKAAEKKKGPAQKGVFKPLPPSLPALMYCEDVVKQIDKKALSHPDLPEAAGVESLAEGLDEAAAGELLLQVVWACRKAGIDAEGALRRTTRRIVDDIETGATSVTADG